MKRRGRTWGKQRRINPALDLLRNVFCANPARRKLPSIRPENAVSFGKIAKQVLGFFSANMKMYEMQSGSLDERKPSLNELASTVRQIMLGSDTFEGRIPKNAIRSLNANTAPEDGTRVDEYR